MKNTPNMPQFSQGQVDQLLKIAGKKMGISPEQLKSQLEQGSLPQGVGADAVSQYLSDPQKIEQLLATPQAQDLLRKLSGGR